MLDSRASQFRSDSSKFVAKSLFEGTIVESNDKARAHDSRQESHQAAVTLHKEKFAETGDHNHKNAAEKHQNAADSHKLASKSHTSDHNLKDERSESAARASKIAIYASNTAHEVAP
jgi:hypothetical protein